MKEEIGVYHGKFKTRKCGVCGEDDTILFCCECLRKQEEKQKEKMIKRLKDKFKSNITVISKRDFLNELKEMRK
jgi:hypothetical protein